MITPLPKGRTEHWTAHAVGPDGNRVRLALDADMPGQVAWDDTRQSPITATLHCHGTPPELMGGQWVDLALHVKGHPSIHWPPLVPVKDNPVYEHGRWFTLQLIDQTVILAADGLDFTQVLPAGTPIVPAMKALAVNPWQDWALQWPAVDHTLRNDIELDFSSSPLGGINRLAEALNAHQMTPRMDGSLAVELWTPPALRAVQMVFGPGAAAGYEHRVGMERLHLEAPNVFHYTGNGSATSDQIIGRWRDEDPSSRYCIQNRRRRILDRASGEAATQELADAKAMRGGLEARGRGRRATIRGGYQPLTPRMAIQSANPAEPDLDADWIIESYTTIISGDASDTTWTIQEVV